MKFEEKGREVVMGKWILWAEDQEALRKLLVEGALGTPNKAAQAMYDRMLDFLDKAWVREENIALEIVPVDASDSIPAGSAAH